jgi:hypothetical protein
MTLVAVISLEFQGPVSVRLLFAVIMLMWLYLLLKGVRWVWIFTLGVYGLGLIDLISGSLTWRGAAVGLAGLLLLLLPETRRYFTRDSSSMGI